MTQLSKYFYRIALITGVLLLAPVCLLAQSTYGTILGTAKDSSGAAIPHASVQITNVDENTVRQVKRILRVITKRLTYFPRITESI